MTEEKTYSRAEELIAEIRWDESGLVPAVVQDVRTKDVLMVAYMNQEALKRTFETGETVFWSRSRQAYWHKGETSGHTQKVVSVKLDCDADTLLIEVVPNGPACHTGETSCFYRGMTVSDAAGSGQRDRFAIIEQLERVIAERERERPEGSYTTYLFENGVDKILKKIGEEAGEVIIAAKNRSHEELSWEMSDLIFHSLVLLQEQKLPLDEVLKHLESRHRPE